MTEFSVDSPNVMSKNNYDSNADWLAVRLYPKVVTHRSNPLYKAGLRQFSVNFQARNI